MTATSEEALRDAIGRIDPTASAVYERDVTQDLIRQYAEVSGDFHRIHIDPDYASSTPYGKPIAHGALLVGFMSTASTLLSESIEGNIGFDNVSLGYDRLRFIRPVLAGDKITTTITIAELQPERMRVICDETCTNQRGETVAVGRHVMRFLA